MGVIDLRCTLSRRPRKRSVRESWSQLHPRYRPERVEALPETISVESSIREIVVPGGGKFQSAQDCSPSAALSPPRGGLWFTRTPLPRELLAVRDIL